LHQLRSQEEFGAAALIMLTTLPTWRRHPSDAMFTTSKARRIPWLFLSGRTENAYQGCAALFDRLKKTEFKENPK
jgi:hypothetical protein